MMNSDDPLKGLLIDTGSVAREEVAAALAPLLQFDESGGVWLLDPFDQLSSENKVMCLLLAVKAQQLLGLREEDSATPQDLAELGQMSGGTIRPKLAKLLKNRQVAKTGQAYHLPPPAMRRAVTRLKEASNNA
jgi:hypothetical protein